MSVKAHPDTVKLQIDLPPLAQRTVVQYWLEADWRPDDADPTAPLGLYVKTCTRMLEGKVERSREVITRQFFQFLCCQDQAVVERAMVAELQHRLDNSTRRHGSVVDWAHRSLQ